MVGCRSCGLDNEHGADKCIACGTPISFAEIAKSLGHKASTEIAVGLGGLGVAEQKKSSGGSGKGKPAKEFTPRRLLLYATIVLELVLIVPIGLSVSLGYMLNLALFFPALMGMYFLPSIVVRGDRKGWVVFWLNFFTAWTGVCWVILMIFVWFKMTTELPRWRRRK